MDKRKELAQELGELTLEIAELAELIKKRQVRANEVGIALREQKKEPPNTP